MITEDYVSFETAKLLEEKGFDEYCPLWYHLNKPTEGPFFYKEIGWYGHNSYCYAGRNIISAPSLQMAIKWLRKVHNIHVVPKFDFYAGDYTGRIYDGRRKSAAEKDDYIAIVGNSTYEKACEEAIKYCLKNLI